MPMIADNDFSTVGNREYWVTSDGRKMYPHQFEDEHLNNTINLLHRRAKSFRLEQAKEDCELVYKTGHRNLPASEYYRYFKQQMDNFLSTDISDKDWLKENSKIYTLLIEEAEYRGLEVKEETKVTWRQKLSYVGRGRSKISSFAVNSESLSLSDRQIYHYGTWS